MNSEVVVWEVEFVVEIHGGLSSERSNAAFERGAFNVPRLNLRCCFAPGKQDSHGRRLSAFERFLLTGWRIHWHLVSRPCARRVRFYPPAFRSWTPGSMTSHV